MARRSPAKVLIRVSIATWYKRLIWWFFGFKDTNLKAIREPNSVPITLNTVFTPGFRDSLDNSEIPDKIVQYLESQFNVVLEEEIRIKRNPKHEDRRVHVVIYFIRATSRGWVILTSPRVGTSGASIKLSELINYQNMVARSAIRGGQLHWSLRWWV